MLFNVIIYLLSFAGIWTGAGIAIQAVERLSKNLKMSSFSISFIILGFFTSIGELSVGVNAIIRNDPEIYVGNLIGASIVIFMMIIPLLAITGNKIQITNEFKGINLILSLIVIVIPVILSFDGQVNRFDSLISIILYTILLLFVQAKKGLLEQVKSIKKLSSVKVVRELLNIVGGLSLVFIASHFVVEKTLYFANIMNISPFLISLLVISIGTNVPELSFVIRSMFMNNNQVAFGNYVGSAAFNTFLLGILTLAYDKPVNLTNSYLVSLSFLIVGVICFYYFSRTKNSISRWEGLILFTMYLLFLLTEVFIHSI